MHAPEETEFEASVRLRAAFERVRNPMLMVDDHRRCVTANAPACELVGIAPEEVPWRRIDDFAPAEDREGLEAQWQAFLANGAVEGWYHLPLPAGGRLPIEFSATANVLPGRHLSVLIPLPADSEARVEQDVGVMAHGESGSMRIVARDADQPPLTPREGEVLALVAVGLSGGAIAQTLVLSPETIKSHVQNAMTKLGAHTRAHAVAIALSTGQIDTLEAP